jgi:hypothetical protein
MNVKIRVMHQNTLNGDAHMPVTDDAEEARSQMAKFQDALGDYYDAGMIGQAPKLDDFTGARG